MRKYLHVEILDGGLFVYIDDKKRGQTYTLEDLDEECNITYDLSKNLNITIPIKSLVGALEEKD